MMNHFKILCLLVAILASTSSFAVTYIFKSGADSFSIDAKDLMKKRSEIKERCPVVDAAISSVSSSSDAEDIVVRLNASAYTQFWSYAVDHSLILLEEEDSSTSESSLEELRSSLVRSLETTPSFTVTYEFFSYGALVFSASGKKIDEFREDIQSKFPEIYKLIFEKRRSHNHQVIEVHTDGCMSSFSLFYGYAVDTMRVWEEEGISLESPSENKNVEPRVESVLSKEEEKEEANPSDDVVINFISRNYVCRVAKWKIDKFREELKSELPHVEMRVPAVLSSETQDLEVALDDETFTLFAGFAGEYYNILADERDGPEADRSSEEEDISTIESEIEREDSIAHLSGRVFPTYDDELITRLFNLAMIGVEEEPELSRELEKFEASKKAKRKSKVAKAFKEGAKQIKETVKKKLKKMSKEEEKEEMDSDDEQEHMNLSHDHSNFRLRAVSKGAAILSFILSLVFKKQL